MKTIFYIIALILIGWMFIKGFQDTTSKSGWYAGTSLYKTFNQEK